MNKFIVGFGNAPREYVINGVRYVVESRFQKPDYKKPRENPFITPLAWLHGRTVISAALRIYEIPRKQKEMGYRPGGGGCGKEHLQNVP